MKYRYVGRKMKNKEIVKSTLVSIVAIVIFVISWFLFDLAHNIFLQILNGGSYETKKHCFDCIGGFASCRSTPKHTSCFC